MSRATGPGVLAWALLAPGVALAETPAVIERGTTLALQWVDSNHLAPTTPQDFNRRLSERLGYPAFDPVVGDHILFVSWLGSNQGCRVELRLVRSSMIEGTRWLESPSGSCTALLPTLLTVSALLIESQDGEASAESAPPTPNPQAPPLAPTTHLRTNARKRPLLMLSVGGTLLFGLAPRGELGPGASLVALPVSALRVGVAASAYLAHEYGANPGLSLSHQSGALLACAMPFFYSFALGLCGSATLHRFSSTGVSIARPERERSSTWTAGLSGRIDWRLAKHFWWTAAAGTELAPSPLYFYVTQADGREATLFTQHRVSLSVLTGLTLELL